MTFFAAGTAAFEAAADTDSCPLPSVTSPPCLEPSPSASDTSFHLPRHRLVSPVPSSLYCTRCAHLSSGSHLLHCSSAPHPVCRLCRESEQRRRLFLSPTTSPPSPPEPLYCTVIGCEGELAVPHIPPPLLHRLQQLPVLCSNAVYGCPVTAPLLHLSIHEASCPFTPADEEQLRSSFPSLSSVPASTPLSALLRPLSILSRCGLTLSRRPPTSYPYVRLQALMRDSLQAHPAELAAHHSSSSSPPSCTCALAFRGLTATATSARKAQAQDAAASALLGQLYAHPLYRHDFLLPLPDVGGANAKSALVNLLRGHSLGKGVGVTYLYQRVVEEGEAEAGSQCVLQYQGWRLGWGVGGRKREACEAASRDALRQLHAARDVVAQYGEELEADMSSWWQRRERPPTAMQCAHDHRNQRRPQDG